MLLADNTSMSIERPQIENFTSPAEYLQQMIRYLKSSGIKFTVSDACKKIPRLSPGLVTLCAQGKRTITPERAPLFCTLLGLSMRERQQFIDWVRSLHHAEISPPEFYTPTPQSAPIGSTERRARKYASSHLLYDWLNVFVKDAFQLPEIVKDPELVFKSLSSLASRSRIQKSLNFLLFHGYLRRSQDGSIVLADDHVSVESGLPTQKIRDFHKAALKVARDGIEKYSPDQRMALSLTVPTSEDSLMRLRDLLSTFGERLQEFCEEEAQRTGTSSNQLHQVTLSLVPIATLTSHELKGSL